MNNELLEEILDIVETHSNKINSLGKSSNELKMLVKEVKLELIREIDNVVSKEIAKLPKQKEIKEPDYALFKSMLEKDLDKYDSKFTTETEAIKNSLKISVIDYIESIKPSLIGNTGKDGKDGF